MRKTISILFITMLVLTGACYAKDSPFYDLSNLFWGDSTLMQIATTDVHPR